MAIRRFQFHFDAVNLAGFKGAADGNIVSALIQPRRIGNGAAGFGGRGSGSRCTGFRGRDRQRHAGDGCRAQAGKNLGFGAIAAFPGAMEYLRTGCGLRRLEGDRAFVPAVAQRRELDPVMQFFTAVRTLLLAGIAVFGAGRRDGAVEGRLLMVVRVHGKGSAGVELLVAVLAVGVAGVTGLHTGGFHQIAPLGFAVLVAQIFALFDIAAFAAPEIAGVAPLGAGGLHRSAFDQLPCALMLGTGGRAQSADSADDLTAVHTDLIAGVAFIHTGFLHPVCQLHAVFMLTLFVDRGELHPAAAMDSIVQLILLLGRHIRPPAAVISLAVQVNCAVIDLNGFVFSVHLLEVVGIHALPADDLPAVPLLRDQQNDIIGPGQTGALEHLGRPFIIIDPHSRIRGGDQRQISRPREPIVRIMQVSAAEGVFALPALQHILAGTECIGIGINRRDIFVLFIDDGRAALHRAAQGMHHIGAVCFQERHGIRIGIIDWHLIMMRMLFKIPLRAAFEAAVLIELPEPCKRSVVGIDLRGHHDFRRAVSMGHGRLVGGVYPIIAFAFPLAAAVVQVTAVLIDPHP